MLRLLLGIFAFLGSATFAHAEIEKFAIPGDKGMQFYWWPKLSVLSGWHQDREHSFQYGANALAPDGYTFQNSETVMYVRAIFKPREPQLTSVESLIEHDKKDFEKNVPGISIQETAELLTADGQKLKSFTFFPTIAGNWERVSYGEEGDFYLLFTISSRSKSGFDAAISSYEKLVSDYRK